MHFFTTPLEFLKLFGRFVCFDLSHVMKFLAQLGILIAIPFLSTLKLHVMLLLMQIVKYFLDNKTFQKVKFVYPKNKDSVELMVEKA